MFIKSGHTQTAWIQVTGLIWTIIRNCFFKMNCSKITDRHQFYKMKRIEMWCYKFNCLLNLHWNLSSSCLYYFLAIYKLMEVSYVFVENESCTCYEIKELIKGKIDRSGFWEAQIFISETVSPNFECTSTHICIIVMNFHSTAVHAIYNFLAGYNLLNQRRA